MHVPLPHTGSKATHRWRMARLFTAALFAVALIQPAWGKDMFDRVQHRYADNDGVRLHYAVAGPESAPLMVFVHGFPDFWYTWREQMAALEDRFRVAALDLRGYNLSDKPRGVENYAMERLVADVVAVITAESAGKGGAGKRGKASAAKQPPRAIVVGHDWGGAISWNVAMAHPDVVRLLVILNLPHPRGLARELATNPDQQRNSQYAFNFQQPDAHESLTAEGLSSWVRDADARKHYRRAFEQSDFEAMLNYYKANYPRPGASAGEPSPMDAAPDPEMATVPNVKCPVLMFHGLDDQALLPGALAGTWNWIDADLTLVTIPGANHFVQQDAPELVSTTMRDWLLRRVE